MLRETLAFFAGGDSLRIDGAQASVWRSEILDFYPKDFVPAHAAGLIACANRHAPRPAPAGYALRFAPYDWRIANRRAASAR